MMHYCNLGNHSFDDGIASESRTKPMTQEELIEALSHNVGFIACGECYRKYQARTNETLNESKEDDTN